MDLGLSLKIALARKKMTQTELANDLGVSRQIVTRWVITGNMPKSKMAELAEYFEMKPSEFVALGEW